MAAIDLIDLSLDVPLRIQLHLLNFSFDAVSMISLDLLHLIRELLHDKLMGLDLALVELA